MKKAMGCMVRGVILIALLAVIGLVISSFMEDGDTETHTLIGEILGLKEEGAVITGNTCTAPLGDTILAGGENIQIEDGSTEGVSATLSDGIVTPEGNCSFEFVADVQDTDLYAFTVNGQVNLRKDTTIGKEIPEGYTHSQADAGDWWVSMWSTDFDD